MTSLLQHHVSTTPPPIPTVLHVSTPNGATNYRLFDIPMGCGWGGSTNIHAGLIMEPPPPPTMMMGGAAAAAAPTTTNNGDEFMSWPGRWKGGKLLRKSMQEIKTVLLMNTKTTNNSSATTSTVINNNTCSTHSRREIIRDDDHQIYNRKDDDDDNGDDKDYDNNYCSNLSLFQPVITSSSSNGGRRVNYFSALVGSLLQEYPTLQQHVIFLPGTFAERILINHNTGHAWGVECCRHRRHHHRCHHNKDHSAKDYYQRIILKSKGEIVLCAGAIGSPALLLASGIGHEDDLHIAGIVPWYDNDCHCHQEEEEEEEGHQQQHQQQSTLPLSSLSSLSFLSSNQLFRTLPVGHNLRDHVLLPRVFITSPLSLHYWWTTTTWRGIVTNTISSYNTIQGILSMNIPVNDSTDHASIQLQLADGGQMDYMIPHFVAGAVRRHWPLFFPSVFDLTSPILPIIVTLFYLLRSFLWLVLRLPPFNWLVRHHMSTLNVCLMNPQSVGKVTVSATCQDNNDDDDVDGDMGCQRIRNTTPRLSNCQILIDPGYLTSSQDVDALWLGWCASSDIIKQRQLFVGCVEILPGSLLYILFTIFTLISYTTSCIAWLIGSHYYHDKTMNESNSSSSSSSSSNSSNERPAWFSNYVAEFVNPYYHWCGTCAMGGEEDDIVIDGKNHNNVNASLSSVVDENLCVRGILGLRICDASVFPDSISAPTALTCAALGYVAASEIFDYETQSA